MRFKPGVKLEGLKPQTSIAMTVANDVFKRYGYEMTVTSVNDGKHSDGSLHYFGKAFDARSKDIRTAAEKSIILTEMRRDLGSEFDVLLEGIDTPNEHYHVEWDPK